MDLVRGNHHLTFCVGPAQEDYDFHTGLLGLRSIKKTALYDGQVPVYHLYYGNAHGDAGTILTSFPFRQAGVMYKDEPDETFVAAVDTHVEAINRALRDVPADRVRLHLCWGNYEGPHHRDIELKKIARGVLKAKPQTILFEAANPRHAHEWAVWRDADIPDDKVLVPGVLDTTTNFVEHPELVKERITRFADIVGPERVAAGTDCGFGTWAGG